MTMPEVEVGEVLRGLDATTGAGEAPGVEKLYELVSTKTVPLTRELAQQIHGLPGSPTERERNESRIKHLKDKFMSGVLIPFQWATAELDGTVYRMNGQHSSDVLCSMDGAFPQNGTVFLSEYKVKNKQGLAQLFRQFDDRRSSRTPADVAGAFQGLVDPIADVKRAAAKIAIEGVAWYNQHIEGVGSLKGDDRYALFNRESLHGFVRFIGDLFHLKSPELRKPSVIAAIYATFLANEPEARKFWDSVSRRGDQYNEESPDTVLDAWLVDVHSSDVDVKPGHIYQGCIFAWNAYRGEREISKIKYDAKTNPKVSE